MIMIGRKRITWLGGMVLLAMLCFTFQSAKLEENAVAVPTVALPVTNRVIVLDAGHGKPDEGAVRS